MSAPRLAPSVQPYDLEKAELPHDDLQELKEAVCDALIERTRRAVSGEDEFGELILGAKPSKTLVSGFLLPGINKSDDEVVSDISISMHGMDIRIDGRQAGEIIVRPSFNMYVRILPEAVDVFDPRFGLRPMPRLKKEIQDEINAERRRRYKNEIPQDLSSRESNYLRDTIIREIYLKHGIDLKPEQIGKEEKPGELPDQDGEQVEAIRDNQVLVPDDKGMPEDIPEAWLRLPVDVPALMLPLPYKEDEWKNAVDTHRILLNKSIHQAFYEWINTEVGVARAWRPRKAPPSAFWTPENWTKFLNEVRQSKVEPKHIIPRVEVALVVDVLRDPFVEGHLTIRLAIENRKEKQDNTENGLFQVNLTVELPKAVLQSMRLERVKPSYHLSGFLDMPAIGVNGGVTYRDLGEMIELRSTWAPRFVLPRIRPTKIHKVPVEYSHLSNPDLDIQELVKLPDEMLLWIKSVENHIEENGLFDAGATPGPEEVSREEMRYHGDLIAWNEEQNRIRLGIQLLQESQVAYRKNRDCREGIAYRAWLATNKSFLEAAKIENPGWRLFQLAFILAHIPTIASRVPEFEKYFCEDYDESKATLLYMSTGGGKSEAFFGILIFTLFFDRLRGKHRGVSAMIHYPLRLLTLQQAQRLMRLLARAEMIRRRMKLDGAPFEIGFWVGSSNTPNHVTDGDDSNKIKSALQDIPLWSDVPPEKEDELQKQNAGYVGRNNAWNKLPRCPFCDSERPTVLRIIPEQQHRLGILCVNQKCDWNRAHDQSYPAPLPFILVDADIYRRAPSILLGTIDKLALIGNHPSTIDKVAGMFGMARAIDPENNLLFSPHAEDLVKAKEKGRLPIAPAVAGGKEVFLDPLPSLIIQDEMHLLEESLGTFGGLFETTLFTWFKELAKLLGHRACRIPGTSIPRMPKIIAATATISDPDRQIDALYQRKVLRFPHPGPQIYRTFYGAPASFETKEAQADRPVASGVSPRQEEINAPWARVYISLLTNGRPHTATTVAVLSAFAVNVTYYLRALTGASITNRANAVADILKRLSNNPLQNRHRRVVEKYQNSHEILANLVDLHRIALTYVTNKKGGDQVMSALHSQTIKDHDRAAPNGVLKIRDFQIDLISGGVDVKGIQAVIQKAESRFVFGSMDISDTLRCIVATSAISHGVDVEKFNSMFFAGMPSDIAEYIQASSRVGRTHVGFSMLIPTPQNRRDRFIVEVHESFHRLLERMISPPAIERWADRALERVIPSLFQTYFAGVLYQQDWVRNGTARFPGTARALNSELSSRRAEEVIKACHDFVARALGVEGLRDESQLNYAKDLVAKQVNAIQGILKSGDYTAELSKFWVDQRNNLHRPMTSLRDVDEVGKITAALHTTRDTTTLDKFGAAMAFIRKRRVSASLPVSEMDIEIDEN
ncbi:DEAD/DEAH box helicase [uncultured Ferrovibrio sp.]|uniref:DEAD/DEAH box helicase n=1 Tax=uncultured Ferrovibrio sp. TaxID=1576913 RepID=UPI00261E2A80|nr:DEAD/DEAH box helicase [uncultured Ferrovibrio sp.]